MAENKYYIAMPYSYVYTYVVTIINNQQINVFQTGVYMYVIWN